MKKVAIIAPTGMLGSMVYNIFQYHYDLTLIYRNKRHLKLLNSVYGGVHNHQTYQFDFAQILDDYTTGFPSKRLSPHFKKLLTTIDTCDAVINCLGIIKPYSTHNIPLTFFINGAIPHILSSHLADRLIHITTDCVYNGLEGAPYDEHAQHTANDLYGLSKSIGEPFTSSLILRTSIIGPEVHGFVSLLEWVKQQKGIINGYTNHYWNGVTTKELAHIMRDIIDHRTRYPKKGIYHVHSNTVSKFDMVRLISRRYGLSLNVIPIEFQPVDRRLATRFNYFTPKSFQDMIHDLN